MDSELDVPGIVPSNHSRDPAPPSLDGVLWGEFPRFAGTMQCSDSLPPIRPRFVAFAWPYRAGLAIRSPARASPPAGVSAFVHPVALPGLGAETSGPPGFLGSPTARMPRSSTAAERDAPCHRATSLAAFRFLDGVGLREPLAYAALSRGLRAPCVRFAAPVTRTPRNTRFPLLARLCGASSTRWAPQRGFRLCHSLPPLPSFPSAPRIQLN